MARLILKCKYLKQEENQNRGRYLKYIATREGVVKQINDTSYRQNPTTMKQKELIEKILKDFPDAREMLEYEDYKQHETVGNASDFITRALEDNMGAISGRKAYADYIATRPGVEKEGKHGLFTDAGIEVDLDKVANQVDTHPGNIWTEIISLRREDAARLGFDSGNRWKEMLRSLALNLAESYKISAQNLQWYAAFHNESYHPHVHLVVWSKDPTEGFLTKEGLRNRKQALARAIFRQELMHVYKDQTQIRQELKDTVKERLEEVLEKTINEEDMRKIGEKLIDLRDRLHVTKGKLVYGYLPKNVKAMVNDIVNDLAKNERISNLYELWYQHKEEVHRIYNETVPERVPLSQNKEFRSIKNAVIREALTISEDWEVEKPEELEVSEADNQEEGITDDDQEGGIIDDDQEENMADDDQEGGIIDDAREEEIVEREAAHQDYSSGGDQKKDTWWSEEYKAARTFLYGTKTSKPDFERAMAGLKEEAQRGNGFAMHDLGKMVLAGLGCEKNEEQAQEWFQKAFSAFCAKEPNEEKPGYLRYRIGKMYAFGYGVDQDYQKAVKWYEKSIAEENPFAAYALGSLYHRGQGVEQNAEKAFELFTTAATDKKRPNAYAQYELGRMCQNGIGTAPDQVASREWYNQAYQGFLRIEQDMADDKLYYRLGQMNLTGTGTAENPEQARLYFEKAAELGNADAMYGLGKLYLNREYSGRDVKKAIDYLTSAAQKDHDYAMYSLGKLFLEGKEIPKNPEYALHWLEEAEKKENPNAAYVLGKARIEGTLLPKDISKAILHLTRAAEQNHEHAQYLLGKLYLAGEDIPKDAEAALYWFTKAADQGNIFAQYQLGKMFLYGRGVEQDIEKAISYLTASADQGNEHAARLLQNMQQQNQYVNHRGFRLLQQLSRLLQKRIEDDLHKQHIDVDRKLRQKIAEKKLAQGLKI